MEPGRRMNMGRIKTTKGKGMQTREQGGGRAKRDAGIPDKEV